MAGAAELARRAQGAYYLVTGVWPVLSFRTFTAVVGPKPDRFQTQAAGWMFVAVGLALQPWSPGRYPARSRAPLCASPRLLAASSSALAAAIELAYRRDLRWVFTADAAVQLAFAGAALLPGPADGSRNDAPATP